MDNEFINNQRRELGLPELEKQKCWNCGKEYNLIDNFSVTCNSKCESELQKKEEIASPPMTKGIGIRSETTL